MKNRARNLALSLAVASILLLCLAAQLQPVVIRALHGADGSFGIRPLSHRCLGWAAASEALRFLPGGEWEFHLGGFHFRYSLMKENLQPGTRLCVGQDLWYGE
jgi:hypothetical protein